jgi:hypothetical protein
LGIFCGRFGILFPVFGTYVVPRKIWQPCLEQQILIIFSSIDVERQNLVSLFSQSFAQSLFFFSLKIIGTAKSIKATSKVK